MPTLLLQKNNDNDHSNNVFVNHRIKNSVIVFILCIVCFGILLLESRQIHHHFLATISQHFETTTTTTISNHDDDDSLFDLANYESFGFFTDITESDWLRRKAIFHKRWNQELKLLSLQQQQNDNDESTKTKSRENVRIYNQHHWQPNFSCEMEDFMTLWGGDGGKWVCDPHRIALQQQQHNDDDKNKNNNCLVYSIGSNNHFDFEQAIQVRLPACEIHIFDPKNYEKGMKEWGVINGKFHPWGLTGGNATVESNGKIFKTLNQTITELGHWGRTIDILKIDCEGCEWTSFRDWFGMGSNNNDDDSRNYYYIHDNEVLARQILIETHGAPPTVANEFFLFLKQRGYVIFHKEPNIMYGGGQTIEYAFLKLRSSFFSLGNNQTTS